MCKLMSMLCPDPSVKNESDFPAAPFIVALALSVALLVALAGVVCIILV